MENNEIVELIEDLQKALSKALNDEVIRGYEHLQVRAETIVKNLNIADVVQQRELLLGLLRFERKNGFETTTLVNEEIVDQYLYEL